MNPEKVKAVFLNFLQKKDASPYITYIEAGMNKAKERLRPEFTDAPPECVSWYAAAAALLMYTNANCAGDNTVCNESGTALIDRDTENIRKAAENFADYCLSLCSKYLYDDKFVIISTKKGGISCDRRCSEQNKGIS